MTTEQMETDIDEIEEQVMRGPKLIEAHYNQLGIDPSTLRQTSYSDLKAAAFDEGYLDELED